MTKSNITPSSKQTAFTLVEVAISLGIFAFAIVSILGVLPSGLGLMREAVDGATSSRILQSIETQGRQQGSISVGSLYFDESGARITQAADSLYTARVAVPAGFTLPGGGSAADIQAVSVSIIRHPGGAPANSPNPSKPFVLWFKS